MPPTHTNGTNVAARPSYGTLEQLARVRRLETDYDGWPVMKIRLQALIGPEYDRILAFGKRKAVPPDEYSASYDKLATIAFGMVQPFLGDTDTEDDLEIACNRATYIPAAVRDELVTEILKLTYRPAREAYQDFIDGAGLDGGGVDTAPSTSSSAKSSAPP